MGSAPVMKAIRLERRGGPLVDIELPEPEPGPGEVVVRVAAAGICQSDTHYRSGNPRLPPLPRVLGHEVAGWVEHLGAGTTIAAGTRVALHYQVGCGECDACRRGADRFCARGQMIGNQRDGGYAERILIPERNLVVVPEEVALTHAAVMMCSSVTALHALRKARLARGERVAVFGAGGLGMSAIQLAAVLGANEVLAVDIDAGRLAVAADLGAVPIDAGAQDPVATIRESGGVDVAVEFVGSPVTTDQALGSLRPLGRAAVAGLTDQTTPVAVYDRLMSREAELIGVMDHTLDEAQEVVVHAAAGALDVSSVVTATVPLDAAVVDARLDHLEEFGAGIRTVIVPGDASPA